MKDKVQLLKTRHSLFKALRSFFDTQGFIEVHTPLLVVNPGLEPQLLPFATRFESQFTKLEGRDYYLPTSPEYHLKKALALGLDKIFEITKSFRNGELGTEHEPEFFMLEWYRNPGSYQDIARDFERLMKDLGETFSSEATAWSQAQHMTVSEAFQRFCKIPLEECLRAGPLELTRRARALGYESIQVSDDFDTCFGKLIVERIEPNLGLEGPLFLWDYPASQCALARLKPDNRLLCERFEVYWRGIELANAFGELTDAAEQRRRCMIDQEERRRLYGKTPPLDEAFLSALERLKGPVGGIAVGVDRLIQCLLGAASLQDVVAFPHSHSI